MEVQERKVQRSKVTDSKREGRGGKDYSARGEGFDSRVEGTHFVQPDYLQATEEYPFPVISIIHLRNERDRSPIRGLISNQYAAYS